jgi:hypothetical protein
MLKIDWNKPIECVNKSYMVEYVRTTNGTHRGTFRSILPSTVLGGTQDFHGDINADPTKPKGDYGLVVLWNDVGIPLDMISGKAMVGHPLTVKNVDESILKPIDWSKPIVCQDSTTAEFVTVIVVGSIPRFRGRYNSTGDLYHEIHWDKFGRMYGSDGVPVEDSRLNVRNT